jgi:hypothetical protein
MAGMAPPLSPILPRESRIGLIKYNSILISRRMFDQSTGQEIACSAPHKSGGSIVYKQHSACQILRCRIYVGVAAVPRHPRHPSLLHSIPSRHSPKNPWIGRSTF